MFGFFFKKNCFFFFCFLLVSIFVVNFVVNCFFVFLNCLLCVLCVLCVLFCAFSPPSAGPPSSGQPKISLFFFLPLPHHFCSFCLSLDVFSLNFGGVFEGRNPKMCTFGVLGRRGFTRQPENSKRAHLRALALHTPSKFHEKTTRERQKEQKWGGRGKKKREILGPPPFGPQNDTHRSKWIGQKWIGQNDKSRLASVCTLGVPSWCRNGFLCFCQDCALTVGLTPASSESAWRKGGGLHHHSPIIPFLRAASTSPHGASPRTRPGHNNQLD